MKKHYRQHNTCLNCGYVVDKYFCSNCGQENIEPHESFFHFLVHGISHYLHFDSKFFNSVVPLITKPGYLTNEYIAGRRASHLGPLGIYLFISFLFFFFVGDKMKPSVGKKEHKKEQVVPRDTTSGSRQDTVTEENYYSGFKNESGTFKPVGLDSTVEAYDGRQAKLSAKEKDSGFTRFYKRKLIYFKQDNGKVFLEALAHNAPKVLFVLLPLFALILKLAFYRSKRYYLDHLIYSMHVHSFLFLLILAAIGFKGLLRLMGIDPPHVGWPLLAIILWYIYASMRRVYKNSPLRTIWKIIILNLAYSFLLLISFLVIGLFTLVAA